jgi:hypothetical protein
MREISTCAKAISAPISLISPPPTLRALTERTDINAKLKSQKSLTSPVPKIYKSKANESMEEFVIRWVL